MTTATIPQLNLKTIRKQLFLSQEKLSSMLKVSLKTLARAEKEGRSFRDSDVRARLVKLNEIANLGQMVYTSEGLQAFLINPLGIFNGYTACDLMNLGDYDRVIGSLAADFEGLGY